MIGWEYGGKFRGLIGGSTEKMIEELRKITRNFTLNSWCPWRRL